MGELREPSHLDNKRVILSRIVEDPCSLWAKASDRDYKYILQGKILEHPV